MAQPYSKGNLGGRFSPRRWAALLLCVVVALATLAGGTTARDVVPDKPPAVSATAVGDPCGPGEHRHLGDDCLAAPATVLSLPAANDTSPAGRETVPFAALPDRALTGNTVRPRPHPPKPSVRA